MSAPCAYCNGTGRSGGIYGRAATSAFCQWCRGTGDDHSPSFFGDSPVPIDPDTITLPAELVREAFEWVEVTIFNDESRGNRVTAQDYNLRERLRAYLPKGETT